MFANYKNWGKKLTTNNYQKFTFPLIKQVYPTLIAKKLVSVQPMGTPTGKLFTVDIWKPRIDFSLFEKVNKNLKNIFKEKFIQ